MWLRVGPLIRLAVIVPGHLERSMESHRAAERALRNSDADALRAAIARDISDAAADLGPPLARGEIMAAARWPDEKRKGA